ncbi:nitroreductase/quinone reductase family protein [Streptomyces sp. NPDC002755]
MQVLDQHFAVRARTATADEHQLMWQLMTRIWPDYDRYQSATERPIPAVLLQPHP